MSCHGALNLPESDRIIELNRSCQCLPLDREAIDAKILTHSNVQALGSELKARENLFAATPVFVAERDVSAILAQIEAVESVVSLDAFRAEVIARSQPAGVATQAATAGALMGYDFHITDEGPRLIEINTNAGGAFLVAAMQRALQETLPYSLQNALNAEGNFESNIVAMFCQEWRRAGRRGTPATLAIVDSDPKNQFLYPEMLLAQEMFSGRGIETFVVDATELTYAEGELRFHNTPIDMVYNRLTDFSLDSKANAAVRTALLQDQCVVTPAPSHHALYADKRNLVLLSNRRQLAEWGLSSNHLEALAGSLKTVPLSAQTAESLWGARKQLFFKPASGFGSKAVYRGSKLTRRVWSEMLLTDYVAQSYAPPPQRALSLLDGPVAHKFDLRVYTYAGRALLAAGRIYQGQATNFRTRGGGFAPVIVVP